VKPTLAPFLAEFPSSRDGNYAYYWPPGADTTRCTEFREFIGDKLHLRKPIEICIQELTALASDYLIEGNADDAVVMRKMAEKLGLKKLLAPTRRRLKQALAMARGRNYLS